MYQTYETAAKAAPTEPEDSNFQDTENLTKSSWIYEAQKLKTAAMIHVKVSFHGDATVP